MFSKYLSSTHDVCARLVGLLKPHFPYVSLLGKHVTGSSVSVATSGTDVRDTAEKQFGYVVKVYNGKCYYDYSFSYIDESNVEQLAKDIIEKGQPTEAMEKDHVKTKILDDEPLVKEFSREQEGKPYAIPEIVETLTKYKDQLHSYSDKVVQAGARYENYEVSSMFISPNRDLKQNYSWCLVMAFAVCRGEKNIQFARDFTCGNNPEKCLKDLECKLEGVVRLGEELLNSTLIEPGVYDIITSPSITGLIAHEAFGHGVEMDMFVKHRSKAKNYIGKRVASDLVNMHDGAGAAYSVASYFFDDDGVLAHDTLIIKNGILQTGISDAVSAAQLGTEPTGNGRRQDPSRKAYTRMTNTFFEPGTDKLEDMITSVKHGYMLFETSNGMEDPKNWNIQCTAQYGREIVDGKFTGKIVAPVVMSGYVPDLLQSISMVSSDFEVIGAGHCGKGYKEWVTVSDGGPCLKARCKLG